MPELFLQLLMVVVPGLETQNQAKGGSTLDEPGKKMLMKCAKCGVESDCAVFLKSEKRVSSQELTHICIVCESEPPPRDWTILWAFLALSIPGVACIYLAPSTMLGPILVTLSLFELASFASLTLHEAGHAVAAWLAGLKVFSVNIGRGRILGGFRLLGARWNFGGVPGGGFVQAGSTSPALYRMRMAICILGGPTANGLILWFALRHLYWDGTLQEGRWQHVLPMVTLAIISFVYLLLSLWPIKMYAPRAGEEERSYNDMRLLISLWHLTGDKIRQYCGYYFRLEALLLAHDGHLQEAVLKAQEGSKSHPEVFELRLAAAYFLTELKQYRDAQSIYESLLADASQNDDHRAVVLNNSAYNLLLEQDDSRLAEADQQSLEALRLRPENTHFQSTRGSVLVELGRADEGLLLLEQAILAKDERSGKALNVCYFGIAHQRRGDMRVATEAFSFARRLDAKCALLEREDVKNVCHIAISRTRLHNPI